MFGRLINVKISNDSGSQLVLVDAEQKYKTLICEADISCMPNKERTSLKLVIYNLDKNIRSQIAADNYRYITIEFGYEDYDGGILSKVFEGTLQRMITQRNSPETSQTIMYAYELGDAYNYGFYSGFFNADTSLYDIIMTVATEGEVNIPVICSETLKGYFISEDKSIYGEQMNILQEVASLVPNIMFMHAMGKVYIMTTTENANSEVIVMSGMNEKGELVSSSGLINIPTLEDDGLSFECLVNPKIQMYSTVLIANEFISDAQEGFERKSSAGAEYDKDGLYVVTRIETHLTNGPNESKMSVRALARSYYTGEGNQ